MSGLLIVILSGIGAVVIGYFVIPDSLIKQFSVEKNSITDVRHMVAFVSFIALIFLFVWINGGFN